MKTRQIHGLGLGEFLIFAPAKEMLKSAYFFSALALGWGIFFVRSAALGASSAALRGASASVRVPPTLSGVN